MFLIYKCTCFQKDVTNVNLACDVLNLLHLWDEYHACIQSHNFETFFFISF